MMWVRIAASTGHVIIIYIACARIIVVISPYLCAVAGDGEWDPLVEEEYQYLDQLLELEKAPSRMTVIPARMSLTESPLHVDIWRRELKDHPDKRFKEFILRGIELGFRIGYDAEHSSLKQRGGNMISAGEQPGVIEEYLRHELQAGRVIDMGSKEEARMLGIQCSPFGVIPKRHKPNKWRLIVNLSAPDGFSVNDGIRKELASLSYIKVDDIVTRILQLGRGTLLAKMDIKQAYRNVPIHPLDRPLLGMCWDGRVYVDAALPFGLRSAPLIFTALADAAQWIMEQRGADLTDHYIDDFVTMGPPNSQACKKSKGIMNDTCVEIGLPPEPEKDEGPATTIHFLGMELDTVALEVRLPAEKLIRLRAELGKWRGRKTCKKRELLSLIGSLSHACKAVRAGRSFLRRLIDLSTSAERPDHFVRMTWDARSDIEWWCQFSASWNGIAMMRSVERSQVSFTMTSDASGNWGCGAFSGRLWFKLQWVDSYKDCHITAKELVPIVIGAAIWGEEWRGQTVRVWCDNAAVVSTINRGSSRNREAMHLARCLAFIKAKLECDLIASHIPGANNTRADSLSRNNLALFRALHPQAYQEPSAIPVALLDMLVLSKPDWTSTLWTELWSSIFRTA